MNHDEFFDCPVCELPLYYCQCTPTDYDRMDAELEEVRQFHHSTESPQTFGEALEAAFNNNPTDGEPRFERAF